MLAEFQAQLAKHRENIEKDTNALFVNEKFENFASYIRKHGNDYFGINEGYESSTREWFTP